MKAKQDVISEFNEYVNMTAEELESWLKSEESNSAGWPKDDANGDGETVGHDSGRKIVEILESNPQKEEDRYTDGQVDHMRKVVAYCSRHLAQESSSNKEKSEEDLKKTKSYASLKNWGHDFLKAQGKGPSSKSSKIDDRDEKSEAKDAEDKSEEEKEEVEVKPKPKKGGHTKKRPSTKRKATTSAQDGENKKRETHQSKGRVTRSQAKENEGKDEDSGGGADKHRGNAADDDDEETDNEEYSGEGNDEDDDNNEEIKDENADGARSDDEDQEIEDASQEEQDGDDNSGGKKPKKGPKKGDTVSWNWGSGQPRGKVLDVKGEKTSITTKRGNEVSRNGNPEDPAVILDTGKSKAIKSNHELN